MIMLLNRMFDSFKQEDLVNFIYQSMIIYSFIALQAQLCFCYARHLLYWPYLDPVLCSDCTVTLSTHSCQNIWGI